MQFKLMELMDGARRFKKTDYQAMQPLFDELIKGGQHPHTLFITCGDSRVIPTLFTQSKPGDLFISRNVGNIVPPYSIPSSERAAVEFAVKKLKVKNIIVCGHSDCGAMRGLLTPGLDDELPLVAEWIGYSHSIAEEVEKESGLGADFEAKVTLATKKNILAQLEKLKTYPLVDEKLRSKEINLHAWFYDIELGTVFIYEPTCNDFIPVERMQLVIVERRKQIVTEIAMNYLRQYIHPQTAKEYNFVTRFFSLLASNLNLIWPQIEENVALILREEFGKYFENEEEFQKMVAQGCKTKLANLKDFQKEIQKSPGYQQFCSQFIRTNFLSQPVPLIGGREMIIETPRLS